MNFKIISFLLVILVSFACSKFKADVSLLKAWGTDNLVFNRKISNEAFLLKFEKAEKRLSYIAANHEIKRNSKTFHFIDNEFKLFIPQVVIIERMLTNNELNSLNCSDLLKEKDFVAGEAIYTACKAIKINIPVLGGEPAYSDFFKTSMYNKKDIVYYLVVRDFPNWKNYKYKSIDYFFKDYINIYCDKHFLCNSNNYSLKDFIKWFESKNKKKFNINNLEIFSSAPIKDGTYIQKISYFVGKIRDQHIVNRISYALNNYDRVLVVYGFGHAYIQQDVLFDLIGMPRVVY